MSIIKFHLMCNLYLNLIFCQIIFLSAALHCSLFFHLCCVLFFNEFFVVQSAKERRVRGKEKRTLRTKPIANHCIKMPLIPINLIMPTI